MNEPDVVLIWKKCSGCQTCGERCRKAPHHLTDGDHSYWWDSLAGAWRWATIAAGGHGKAPTLLWAIEDAYQARKDRADARNRDTAS